MKTPYEKENLESVYSTANNEVVEEDYSMLGMVKREDGMWEIDETLLHNGEDMI